MAETDRMRAIEHAYQRLSNNVQRDREAKIRFRKKTSLDAIAGFFLPDKLTKDQAERLYEGLGQILAEKYRAFPRPSSSVIEDGYLSSFYDLPIVNWNWPKYFWGLKNPENLPVVEEYEQRLLEAASVTFGIEISQVTLAEARRYFRCNEPNFDFSDLRENGLYNLIGTFTLIPGFVGSDGLYPDILRTVRGVIQPNQSQTVGLFPHK